MKGKPFTDVLGEIENGELLRDLTEAVYNITFAVMETRKPGELKITLKFVPTGKSVEVLSKYDSKEPEHDRMTTTFFVAQDGALVRNDPNQPRLPLREVDAAQNDPIKVNNGA